MLDVVERKETKKGWEKERRDRLNTAFDNLGKLLPCFDPSIKLCKIDVLEKAAKYIDELNGKVNKPLTDQTSNDPETAEIKKLFDRVNKLLSRNELLNTLLKDAGIKPPKEYGFRKITPRKKWSQKISPNLAKTLAQNEAQKENKPTSARRKVNKVRTVQKVSIPKNKRSSNNVKPRRRKNSAQNKATIRLLNQNIVPVANVQPCYFISNQNNGSRNTKQNTNVVVNSAPVFTTNLKPSAQILNTLIVGNNNIPQPLFQTTPILIRQNLPTYILVSNTQANPVTSAVSDSSKVTAITKILANIRPKRSVTTTTQINKVPIPALTSKYGNNCLVLSSKGNQNKPSENKVVSKKVKRSLNDAEKSSSDESIAKKRLIDSSVGINNLVECDNLSLTVKDTNIPEQIITNKLPIKEHVQQISTNSDCVFRKESLPQSSSVSAPSDNISSNILLEPPKEPPASNVPLQKTVNDQTVSLPKVSDIPKIAKPEIPILKDSNIITDKDLLSSINNSTGKDIETMVNQTELSNDIFATLQVPSGSQNPESTSPTAAFLNAFPLVSSKIQEVLEDETSDSRRDTPTLLQIGTMDVTKTTQTSTDNLTPNLMNLDNFSFFNAKDICSNVYPSFDSITTTASNTIFTTPTASTATKISAKISKSNSPSKEAKIIYENTQTTNFNVSVKTSVLPVVSQTQVPINNATKLSETQDINPQITNLPVAVNNLPKVQTKPSLNVVKKNLFTTTENPSINTISNQMYYSSVTTVQSSISSISYNPNKVKPSPEKYPKCPPMQQSIKNNQIPEYNTLNPFNDTPKTSSTCAYNITGSKSYSDVYGGANCNYNYQSEFTTNYNSNKQYYNKDNTRYYGYENYDKFDSNNLCAGTTNYYVDKNKCIDQKTTTNKAVDIIPKAPVNWMTTPDLKQNQINTDFLLFPPNKDSEVTSYSQNNFNNNQNAYFNATAPIYPITTEYNMISDPKKHFDLPFQRSDHEEQHQINWSPTKHVALDTSHNFATLPTLEGDLALGTQSSYVEPKLTPRKDQTYKAKETRRNIAPSFEVSNTFLSVSQLVEPSCAKATETPARVSNRRNSGGRTKAHNNQASNKNKRSANKAPNEVSKDTNYSKNTNKTQNQYKSPQNQTQTNFLPDHNVWLPNNSKGVTSKNISSSNYSAESLIGHHPQADVTSHVKPRSNQQYNYHKSLPPPSFLSDNIMPYFPSVDIPTQDNNNQHNQSFGTNSFPAATFPVSIQNTYNNNYNITTPNITTNYLQPPNYMADLSGHDYGLLGDNIFSHTSSKINDNFAAPSNIHKVNENTSKSCAKGTSAKLQANTIKPEESTSKKHHFNYTNANYLPQPIVQKKSSSKKKPSTETTTNLSNIDFGFLSMPGNINSPILPDEFHTNFLPPPPNPHQLYPCKSSLYGTKQSSDLTSGNLLNLPPVTRSNIQHPEISPSSNIGSTLTNFNLSTIFPEMNKISVPSENYLDCRSKHLPIPFGSKSTYTNNYSVTTSTATFTNP